MTVRLAINGFGRTGRSFLRAALGPTHDFEVVAINDLGSPAALARLLARDSVHGPYPEAGSRRGRHDDRRRAPHQNAGRTRSKGLSHGINTQSMSSSSRPGSTPSGKGQPNTSKPARPAS